MEKTFLGIRNVDKEELRKFKAIAIEDKLKLGEAITKAMMVYRKKKIESKDKENKLKGIKELLKVKPFNWGIGTEKTSREIDEILYGLKK